MPSDETRRLLRTFGVAMTTYEDALTSGAPREEIQRAEVELRSLFEQMAALIERLKSSAK